MLQRYPKLLRCCLLLWLAFIAKPAAATHIYGADFYYTYVSGNTYTISLAVYGDCSGQAFPYLNGGTPGVQIYDGGSLVQNILLSQNGPGVEVTPVCPADAGNTVCSNPSSTIPGVYRYIYSATINLGYASSGWLFRFNGDMGNSSSAGRSNAITNIISGTIMALEATLNNTGGANSSPVYTTIPTPFFCINKPASYNPGAVDPNGDALSFSLVNGLQQSPPGGYVTYVNPYNAAAPLGTSAGAYSFDGNSGQLDFTPNIIQRALAVGQVQEYRNGVLVGTSMREMTFVVLTCSNNPPGGNASNAAGGATVVNVTTVKVCNDQGGFSFQINPTDADGDNITMSWAGLPAGATLTVSGNGTASPNGTFSWTTSGVANGNYTFFVTYTDNGCPLYSKQTIAYTVKIIPAPQLAFQLTQAATCSKKAKFTMTPATSTAPYTIDVLQGGATLHTFTGLAAGSAQTDSLSPGAYVIKVTGANGCDHDTTITIAAPPVPAAAVTFQLPSCIGSANGKIFVTGNSGLSPYQYALGAGAFGSSGTFINLAAGSYVLHIRDANDCIKDTTVTLPNGQPIKAYIYRKRPTCNATSDGKITVVGFNSVGPYTYAIGSGAYSSANVFNSLAAGTYILHIKNSLGCILDTTATLTDSLHVTAQMPVTNVSCNGAGDGSITITGGGAVSPYTCALGSGTYSATNTFGSLTPGGYSLHIHDALGCHLDTSFSITQPAVLNASSVKTNVACNGGSSGSVTVTATGGTIPYTYQKNSGPFVSSNVFTGLIAGTYSITVKDAHGCLKTLSVTITEPAPLVISFFSLANPTCNSVANGSVNISGGGGTTPYSYGMNAGAYSGSGSFTTVGSGTQTVHIKDANGCIKDTVVTLTQPAAIIPAASVQKSVCSTLANGKVTLTASGGTPGYTFAQGSGGYSTTGVFSPLAAAIYTFHVKDANGCVKDTVITVADSLVITASLAITNATCYDTANGAISVTPGGGIVPYLYAIGTQPFSSGATFQNLVAGSYVISVQDANGCLKTTNATITQPTVVAPQVSITQPLCYGQTNGSITLSATGGTPAYQYALGAGAFSGNGLFSNLGSATYALHVADNNGCYHDTTVSMSQPSSLTVTSVTGTDVLCHGGNSGTATVLASGGTPPYSFSADGGALQAAGLLTGLNAGLHPLHVQDANGCALDTSITLGEPDALFFVNAQLTMPTCEGFPDGAVTLTGGGGIAPYQYAIGGQSFSSNPSFSALVEGSYTFTLQDAHQCPHDTGITLIGYPHILFQSIDIKGVACFGDKNGTITLTGAGGVQPLSYQLLPNAPDASGFYDSLATGGYTLRITDSKGCIKDSSVFLPTPEKLSVTTESIPNDCNGHDDEGGVRAVVQGGTEPYHYFWGGAPGPDANEFRGLSNGQYVVQVTDANQCFAEAPADVMYDDCCKPFVPIAFTPNGDGRNDVWRIRMKGDAQLESLSVFNRYGQRVFYTSDIDAGWDGSYNSTNADIGTYFYLIKMTCGNRGDHHLELKGDLTLIR